MIENFVLGLATSTPSAVESITTDMTSALTTAGEQLLGAVGDIAPVAITVMVGVAVVFAGIGIFRKVTGAKKLSQG